VSVADDLVEALAPWMTSDFEDYLRAIGEMFAETELYSADSDDGEGWTILLDPDRCPPGALDYLAQFPGERLPAGLSDALKRERIKDRANQLRGTTWSIFAAAQRSLTGSRLVAITEQYTADPDKIRVVTYTAQTPNPAQVLADLLEVVDIDLSLTYETLDGQTWNDAGAAYATWNDAGAAYATWNDAAADLAGTSTFSRPAP
jgi:hypothetical protein